MRSSGGYARASAFDRRCSSGKGGERGSWGKHRQLIEDGWRMTNCRSEAAVELDDRVWPWACYGKLVRVRYTQVKRVAVQMRDDGLNEFFFDLISFDMTVAY